YGTRHRAALSRHRSDVAAGRSGGGTRAVHVGQIGFGSGAQCCRVGRNCSYGASDAGGECECASLAPSRAGQAFFPQTWTRRVLWSGEKRRSLMAPVRLFPVAMFALMLGCSTTTKETGMTRKISSEPWGKTKDGEQVELYTLTNAKGASATIMTYGGRVVTLK